jgi:NAD+ synthase (glutamine-hydrolysing)
MHGFYRLAAAVPELKVADIDFNARQIIRLTKQADSKNAAVVTFPELSLTGYTCGDLFLQSSLHDAVASALDAICKSTRKLGIVCVVGAPLFRHNRLYNCAVLIQRGSILGAVPKTHIPNYKEFYEKRWFTSGLDLETDVLSLADQEFPFGTDLIFTDDQFVSIGIELCEDLWNVLPPSSFHANAGANVLLNLSASNELVSKADYRSSLVVNQSARCVAAYVYTSSGVHESTTDTVYGGHAMICENGSTLVENDRFNRKSSVTYADVDCQRLFMTRLHETTFDSTQGDSLYSRLPLGTLNAVSQIKRRIDPHPFVPSNAEERDHRCEEIISIQSAGLAKRLEHSGIKKAVIGISGGLDSTLALLVTVRTFALLKRPMNDIIAITMPGFGTTDRTRSNATDLCKKLGTDYRKIDITKASLQHFKDIGYDASKPDVTYENVQARERTQILMDIANREGGLVIGTGDLSEFALGWATYNGDHMSMYAVNCSIPKSLIKYLVQWFADHNHNNLKKTLTDVLDTPITPELMPKGKGGSIEQKTEDIIGPYELHDFFLYHMLKYGAEPDKILHMATMAFKGTYSRPLIRKWLTVFIKRFFTQQFKRSCVPDGPKVGTISLSPRADWRMPSYEAYATWLNRLEK